MTLTANGFHSCRLWQAFKISRILRVSHNASTRLIATKAYSGKEKERLLKGVTVEHREDVARILEQGQRAESTWTAVFTDFYTPPVIADALQAFKLVPDVNPEAWGGYEMAERTRIRLSRADMPEDSAALGEQGAHILVVPELVSHLEMSLMSVRSVPVSTRQIELSELAVREVKVQEMKSVEASLRLDAIASAGFRTSRSKIVDMVKAGDIRVNWKESKASSVVKAGDIISCAGKGRCEVKAVELTKKERYAVQLVRYV